jgi:hypothetical protein
MPTAARAFATTITGLTIWFIRLGCPVGVGPEAQWQVGVSVPHARPPHLVQTTKPQREHSTESDGSTVTPYGSNGG